MRGGLEVFFILSRVVLWHAVEDTDADGAPFWLRRRETPRP